MKRNEDKWIRNMVLLGKWEKWEKDLERERKAYSSITSS